MAANHQFNEHLMRKLYNRTHIYGYYWHKRKAYLRLAKKMLKSNKINKSLFNSSILDEYKRKWKPIDPFPNPLFFMFYSSINKKVDLNYIPDYLYSFPVDAMLSNMRYALSTEHKGLYQKRLPEFAEYFPRSFMFKINGVYYDQNYKLIGDCDRYIQKIDSSEIVFKAAIDSGSGRDVFLLSRSEADGKFYTKDGVKLSSFVDKYCDFLLQERVKQNNFMMEINPSSVNTIRVVTYRSVITEETKVMQMFLRAGAEGHFHDNLHAGGSITAILNGQMANVCMDQEGKMIPQIRGGNPIPNIDTIKQVACEIAKKDYFARQLFFDFYIKENGEIGILEINLTSFPTIQAICGPAFMEYTDEVINYCQKSVGFINRVIPFRNS
ncbi:MAG: sugar-transfer associated ATP-grasp domain-containing protein [Candidatus Cloacimonetes bacterium]|jgi:hypothetical protein|nr:sugar-transfer associated ATP-grasp domain-containing protein [Candidatus Cloacimonadota bacterium]